MNSKITFKSLIVVICLLLSFNLQAQDAPPVTVNVATAGTLPSLIASTNKDPITITNLTITGSLNGTDIRFIREMAGRDISNNVTEGKLSVLDLSGANIVAGGSIYYGSNTTSLNTIGDDTFQYCTRLTSITLPNSITSIGDAAFMYCTGLTSITIPNSVTKIWDRAFIGCAGLTSITIPNSVTTIGNNTFEDCAELISITIPNSVTTIGDRTFNYCTGLISITIPNSVTTIGNYAFKNCTRLTSITIPNSVTTIGDGAFQDCTGLKEIYCKVSIPPLVNYFTFNGMDKAYCKLYVPKGTYQDYWIALGWSDFKNIIEEEATGISQIKASNVKVYTESNAIVVENTELGDNISVYTESGALLQTVKVTDNTIRVAVPVNHTYLVRTTGKTFKVAL